MEHRFQQPGVLRRPPSVTVGEVVPDNAPGHGFVQEVRQGRPCDARPRVDDRIASAAGEMPERLGAKRRVPPAVIAKLGPEGLVGNRARAVGRKKGRRRRQPVQAADLGQRADARLDGADPSGQTVTPPFDAQGRAPGDHRAHGRVVDQGLQLHVPAGDDLHLVEEEMRPLPGVRKPVEMRTGDVVLEPVRDAQDRIDEVAQRGQLVELHPENRVRSRALREQSSMTWSCAVVLPTCRAVFGVNYFGRLASIILAGSDRRGSRSTAVGLRTVWAALAPSKAGEGNALSRRNKPARRGADAPPTPAGRRLHGLAETMMNSGGVGCAEDGRSRNPVSPPLDNQHPWLTGS